jgi:SPP1 gp7 family putative phage head morphogenesis protein
MKRKLTDVPSSLKNIDVKAVLRSRGVYFAQKQNKAMKEAAIPMARKLIKGKQKVVEAPKYSGFTNDEALAYWEKQIHIVDVLEKKFETKIQQFVQKMVNGFLSNIEQEIAVKSNKKAIVKAKAYFEDSEGDLQTTAQLDFTPLLIDQAVLAGQEALKLVGSKDIYTPYKLRNTIADNVAKFTQSMIDTDRSKLVDILTNGLKDGKSIPEIRGMIQADFADIEKNQAQLITRTEVLRASVQASKDAYAQSGLVDGVQWLTAGADDECADYEGDIQSLDGQFYSDTTEFADGDPPLHPNCRCVLLPVLIDESKAYIPQPNKALVNRIKELESEVDKRTKDYREIKSLKVDDEAYIKALEGLINE